MDQVLRELVVETESIKDWLDKYQLLPIKSQLACKSYHLVEIYMYHDGYYTTRCHAVYDNRFKWRIVDYTNKRIEQIFRKPLPTKETIMFEKISDGLDDKIQEAVQEAIEEERKYIPGIGEAYLEPFEEYERVTKKRCLEHSPK